MGRKWNNVVKVNANGILFTILQTACLSNTVLAAALITSFACYTCVRMYGYMCMGGWVCVRDYKLLSAGDNIEYQVGYWLHDVWS